MQESRIIKIFVVSAMFVMTLGPSSCYGRSGPGERFSFKYQSWSTIEIAPNEEYTAAYIGKDRILLENWISLFGARGEVIASDSCGKGAPADIVWDASSSFFLVINEGEQACLYQVTERELKKVRELAYPEGISMDAGAFYNGAFYLFGAKESHGLFDSVHRVFYRFDLIGDGGPYLKQWVNIESGGRVKLVFHGHGDGSADQFFIWQLNCIEEWSFSEGERRQRACNNSGPSEFPVEDVVTAWATDVWGIDMDDSVFVWDWSNAVPEEKFKFEYPFVQFSAHRSGLYFLLGSREGEPGTVRHYSRQGDLIRTVQLPWKNVFCMDLSENKIAVLSNTGEVFVAGL